MKPDPKKPQQKTKYTNTPKKSTFQKKKGKEKLDLLPNKPHFSGTHLVRFSAMCWGPPLPSLLHLLGIEGDLSPSEPSVAHGRRNHLKTFHWGGDLKRQRESLRRFKHKKYLPVLWGEYRFIKLSKKKTPNKINVYRLIKWHFQACLMIFLKCLIKTAAQIKLVSHFEAHSPSETCERPRFCLEMPKVGFGVARGGFPKIDAKWSRQSHEILIFESSTWPLDKGCLWKLCPDLGESPKGIITLWDAVDIELPTQPQLWRKLGPNFEAGKTVTGNEWIIRLKNHWGSENQTLSGHFPKVHLMTTRSPLNIFMFHKHPCCQSQIKKPISQTSTLKKSANMPKQSGVSA